MKNWYKSRTVWFNIGTFILICASELSVLPIRQELILILNAMGNIILRFLTSEGLK